MTFLASGSETVIILDKLQLLPFFLHSIEYFWPSFIHIVVESLVGIPTGILLKMPNKISSDAHHFLCWGGETEAKYSDTVHSLYVSEIIYITQASSTISGEFEPQIQLSEVIWPVEN